MLKRLHYLGRRNFLKDYQWCSWASSYVFLQRNTLANSTMKLWTLLTRYTHAHHVPHAEHVKRCRLDEMAKSGRNDIEDFCCGVSLLRRRAVSAYPVHGPVQVISCHCCPVVFNLFVGQLIIYISLDSFSSLLLSSILPLSSILWGLHCDGTMSSMCQKGIYTMRKPVYVFQS